MCISCAHHSTSSKQVELVTYVPQLVTIVGNCHHTQLITGKGMTSLVPHPLSKVPPDMRLVMIQIPALRKSERCTGLLSNVHCDY